MYIKMYSYTLMDGSKVYPWKSSFIYYSENVAVSNVNDLRQIFNRSYVNTKKMYIKMAPCGLTACEGNKLILFL